MRFWAVTGASRLAGPIGKSEAFGKPIPVVQQVGQWFQIDGGGNLNPHDRSS